MALSTCPLACLMVAKQDALLAYDAGLAGVVLSNHGGRQLEFSRSGIETLVEVVTKLKEKRGLAFPNEKFQLFVDGGVRRASDVLKAIALGATAGVLPLLSMMGMFLIPVIIDSWCRTTVLVRILVLRPGRCRTRSPDSTCKFLSDSMRCEMLTQGAIGRIRDEYAFAGCSYDQRDRPRDGRCLVHPPAHCLRSD